MPNFPTFFKIDSLLSFLSPFPTVLWLCGFVFYLLSMVRFLRFFEFPAILMGTIGCLLGWLSLEKSTLAVSTQIEGFAGPFLLPIPKQNTEIALVFMAAGWSSALFLFLLKQKTLSGKEIPKLLPAIFSISIALGLGYIAQGTKEAVKMASQPETPDLIPDIPLNSSDPIAPAKIR
jgi:hypothetical protein